MTAENLIALSVSPQSHSTLSLLGKKYNTTVIEDKIDDRLFSKESTTTIVEEPTITLNCKKSKRKRKLCSFVKNTGASSNIVRKKTDEKCNKKSDYQLLPSNIEKSYENEKQEISKKKCDIKHYNKDNDKKIRDFFELQCELCGIKSITFRDVKEHYRIEHNQDRGYVSCCKRKFFRRGTLLDHLSWHLNPNDFRLVD